MLSSQITTNTKIVQAKTGKLAKFKKETPE